jgi:AraC-like DNA-binding protein
MIFAGRSPSRQLSRYVEQYWYFEGTSAPLLERVLPTSAMQLLVNLDGERLHRYSGPAYGTRSTSSAAAWSGCQCEHFAIDVGEQRRIAGVRFRPGGAAAFLPLPASELLNEHVAVDEVRPAARELRERLLEATPPSGVLSALERWLEGQLDEDAGMDAGLRWGIAALERGEQVATVVRRLGSSPRSFIAAFESKVGLKPKTFARLARLQRVIAAGQRGNWAAAAAHAGYADQSHLTREFKELVGTTPAAYVNPCQPSPTPG